MVTFSSRRERDWLSSMDSDLLGARETFPVCTLQQVKLGTIHVRIVEQARQETWQAQERKWNLVQWRHKEEGKSDATNPQSIEVRYLWSQLNWISCFYIVSEFKIYVDFKNYCDWKIYFTTFVEQQFFFF